MTGRGRIHTEKAGTKLSSDGHLTTGSGEIYHMHNWQNVADQHSW